MSIRRLSFLTIILTFCLIAFGGYVASSQSEMGCGSDWPLCNGEIIPYLKGDTLIAFTHRAIGAVLGVSTVILYFKILRAKVSPTIRKAANWMMVLFFVQILLEAFGVWFEVPTFVIAGHLIVQIIFLACVLGIWSRSGIFKYASLNYKLHKKITAHLKVLLALVVLTLFVGAYVKHDMMGTSCGWLACGESIVPTTGPQLIQTTYSLLGIILAVYSLLLTYWSVAKGWSAHLQKRFKLISMTVVMQVVLGVLTVVTHIDMRWAILHVAVGILLFAIVVETRLFMTTIVLKKGKVILFSTTHMLPKKNGKSKNYLGQP